MQQSLIKLFNIEESKSYAIIGNSKNAGKTTVLNKLIKDISDEKKRSAVSSIGWDGEIVDRVYKTEKPAIIIPKKSFVATCKELLPINSSLFKIHEDTCIETILGSIYIVEALHDMKVEVVGPRDLRSTKNLIDNLKKYADYIILDGALNRSTSASSMITDGFIFSLVYSGKESLNEFEKNIRLFYEKLSNFEIADREKFKLEYKIDVDEMLNRNLVTIGSENNVKFLDFQNPIHNEEKLLSIENKVDWIYLPGAITDIMIEKFSNFFVDITIIIDDWTKNFLSLRAINILKNRNCNIYYLFN
ncbi:MAG: hypothetical protein WH035_06255, partial [Spirochaetota bacterium]